jgi:hypothetical protein
MPSDGPWDQPKLETFERWMAIGAGKRATRTTADARGSAIEQPTALSESVSVLGALVVSPQDP